MMHKSNILKKSRYYYRRWRYANAYSERIIPNL
jgi:hypothetical protein